MFKCVGGGNVSALTQGSNPNLLPMPAAASTPQKIILNGTLTVDVEYTFADGSEIVCAKDAKILIKSAKKLNLVKTKLRGCKDLWEGIELDYGAIIDIKGGSIYDAKIGVHVTFNNSGIPVIPSSISSEECCFYNNREGIHIGNGNSIIPKSVLTNGISGNLFEGGELLGVWPVEISQFGIVIENVTSFHIAGGAANIFRKYKRNDAAGIKILNTNVTISKSTFLEIGYPVGNLSLSGGGGKGIQFESEFGANLLTLSSDGTSVTNTFDEVSIPIHIRNGHVNLSGYSSKKIDSGVLYFGYSSVPSAFKTNNFDISDYNFQAIKFESGGNYSVEQFEISEEGTITNSSWTQQSNIDERYGIYLNLQQPLSLNNGAISHINYSSTPKGNRLVEYAIYAKNASYGRFSSNHVSNLDNVGGNNGVGSFTGIKMVNGVDNEIKSNRFRNISPQNLVVPGEGISLSEMNNTDIVCNTVQHFTRGTSIDGINCNSATVRGNEFLTNDYGFYLDNTAVIGEQPAHENEWPLAMGTEAYLNFPGYNPGDPDHRSRVEMSRFLINNSDPSTKFWPNPRLVGGIPDNHIWFKYDAAYPPANPYTTFPCSNGDCCEGDNESEARTESIVNGTYPSYGDYPAIIWEDERSAYIALKRQESNLSQTGAAYQWLQEKALSPLADLQELYEATQALSEPDTVRKAQFDSFYTSLRNLHTEMGLLNDAIALLPSNSEDTALFYQRNVLAAQLETLQIQYNSYATAYQEELIQRATQLLQNASQINVSTIWEQNFLEVMRIWLELRLSSEKPTEQQTLRLQEIAQQCRVEGGYGVVLARLTLDGPYSAYASYDACVEEREGRHRSGFNQSEAVAIVPNPAKDFITLQFAHPVSTAHVAICGPLGNVLYNAQVSGATPVLDISALETGVYYLTVRCENAAAITRKIVILK